MTQATGTCGRSGGRLSARADLMFLEQQSIGDPARTSARFRGRLQRRSQVGAVLEPIGACSHRRRLQTERFAKFRVPTTETSASSIPASGTTVQGRNRRAVIPPS